MKANIKKIRSTRVYSEDFKRKLVRDFEKGKFSVLELSKLHHVHKRTLYRWITKYSDQSREIEIVEMKDSSTKKLKDLESRVKDLESVIGQKQMHIDYLEKMMEIAKDQMGVDIKKNFSTQRSSGSEKTPKK